MKHVDQANLLILLNALRAADGEPAIPPGEPMTLAEYAQNLDSVLTRLSGKGMDVAVVRKGVA